MTKYNQSICSATHLPIELDVTNAEQIKSVLDQAIDKYKRPPTLAVNCAGITRDAFLLKMDDSDFDLVLNVNLKVKFMIFLIQHNLLLLILSRVTFTGNIPYYEAHSSENDRL